MDLILQRILSCSKEFLGRIPPSQNFTRLASERISSISLPEPPSLLSALINVGAPIALAEEMQGAYQQCATELKQRYETAASQVILSLSQYPGPSTPPSLQPKLLATINKLYTTRLEDWRRDCLSLYKRHAALSTNQEDHSQRGRGGTHTTFNIDYVPLLEHFFEENPFPSHADKVSLAKKSGMTYRQIHVWFQNKRTRSRKDRKKAVLKGATFPIDTLYDGTKQCMKRNSIRTEQLLLRDGAVVPSDTKNPLNAPAPPHAFPSTYPPPPRYKPFPENGTLQSHLLPWPRRPSPVRSPSLAVTSVSDVIEMFSQLNIRDDHGHQRQQVRLAHIPEIGAAVASITVKPFSAPLFATCGSVAFVTKAALNPFPTVSAPRTLLYPFRTPSFGAQPVTLMHCSTQKTSGSGRKVAPLPKRMPQVSTKNKQNRMHSTLDYSSYRSLSCSSVRSSSSEFGPSVATTPEVSSPISLSLPDEVSPIQESCLLIGHDVVNDLPADHLSGELQLDSLPPSNPTCSTTSEISVPRGNSNAIMRAMRRAVSPPHTRLPLCVGS